MSLNTAAEGRQIPLDTANKAQLRAFLTHLGGNPTNFDTDDKLREKIAAQGWEESHIIALDNAKAPSKDAPKGVPKPGTVAEPMVNLTIHTQDGAGGKRAVFVGVNGRALLIPRNEPCDVKLRYFKALEAAIETKYEFDEDAKANTPRDMPSYPYQVHKMPSEEEQERWYAYERSTDLAQRARDQAEEDRIREQAAA